MLKRGGVKLETCFNYCSEQAFFSSDERKWINHIRKLKEQYPDQITILAEPETNDGCIYCRLPPDWLHVKPKLVKNLTEEQRKELSDRMMKLREKLSEKNS